jgi:hypothetical protein
VIVALAALSVRKVEFERHRMTHRGDCGIDRLLGDQRSAEIGVQHGAGEIEYRPQAWPRAGLEPGKRARDRIVPRDRKARRARLPEHSAHGADHSIAPEAADRVGGGGRAHHFVDGREPAGSGFTGRHRRTNLTGHVVRSERISLWRAADRRGALRTYTRCGRRNCSGPCSARNSRGRCRCRSTDGRT